MRAEIEKWFAQGCDYEAGAELYAQYGKNAGLKTLFCSRSPYSENRLRTELREMASAAAPVPRKYEKIKYDPSELSPELQMLFAKKGRLYGEASHLHSELFYERDKNKLAKLRADMVSRLDEISRIWKRCDEYIIKKRAQPESPVSLIQQRNNLRSRISKNKSNPEKLAILKQELADVETKLTE